MLETLEKSNIKKMGVEETEKGGLDFHVEISEKDIKGMRDTLNFLFKNDQYNFCNLAKRMKALGLPIVISEEELMSIRTAIPFVRTHQDLKNLICFTEFLNIFSGPFIPEEANIQELKEGLIIYRDKKDWLNFIECSKSLKSFDIYPDITPEDITEMKEALDSYIERRALYSFSILAQDMMDLNITFEINPISIQIISKEMDGYRSFQGWLVFSHFALLIKSYNSYLESNKPLPAPTPPIPEQKKF